MQLLHAAGGRQTNYLIRWTQANHLTNQLKIINRRRGDNRVGYVGLCLASSFVLCSHCGVDLTTLITNRLGSESEYPKQVRVISTVQRPMHTPASFLISLLLLQQLLALPRLISSSARRATIDSRRRRRARPRSS